MHQKYDNASASRKYRRLRFERAKEGDLKAINQIARDRYNSSFSNARNFVKKRANQKDLEILREMIKERLAEFETALRVNHPNQDNF